MFPSLISTFRTALPCLSSSESSNVDAADRRTSIAQQVSNVKQHTGSYDDLLAPTILEFPVQLAFQANEEKSEDFLTRKNGTRIKDAFVRPLLLTDEVQEDQRLEEQLLDDPTLGVYRPPGWGRRMRRLVRGVIQGSLAPYTWKWKSPKRIGANRGAFGRTRAHRGGKGNSRSLRI